MAKRKAAMDYRHEALTRVLYFSGAFLAAALAGCAAGLIAGSFFNGGGADTQRRIFAWTAAIVFAIVCSLLVYRIDLVFDKRFNKNP